MLKNKEIEEFKNRRISYNMAFLDTINKAEEVKKISKKFLEDGNNFKIKELNRRDIDYSGKNFFRMMELPDLLFIRSCYIRLLKRSISEAEEKLIIDNRVIEGKRELFVKNIILSDEFRSRHAKKFKQKKLYAILKLTLFNALKLFK
ncbi:MAG TPA: hypothetical protein DIV86_01305 [Alphaproteobacteria bacterium]|nr:hypothetical protein [Alphaproteobacteria bacterium]